MEGIVKGKNRAYARYEEALLRRDGLRREADNLHLEYIRLFGDLIEQSFRLKIECIQKKKMIAYCQQKANKGEKINGNALADYIAKQMASYQQELDDLVKGVQAAREATEISAADVKRIKDIYHRLAKKIHPDLHPEYADDETMKEFWHRIVVAYHHNQLKEMEELQALVESYLTEIGEGTTGFAIPDVEERIADVEREIERILSTNPYLYKLILEDKQETAQQKRIYEEEIRSYTVYSAQLDDVLATFEIERWLS